MLNSLSVTILALDLGDSVMINPYVLTSSCRLVGSRKQCKSDQPASTLVWVSSHFFCDSSLLHGSGATLIYGRFGTVASVYRASASPIGSVAATSAATAGSSGPGTPSVSGRSRPLWASFHRGYSRHGKRSLSLHILQSGGLLSRQRVGSWVWKKFWDRRSCRPTTKQASTSLLSSLRFPWRTRLCTISWLRRAEAERRFLSEVVPVTCWSRGMASDGPFVWAAGRKSGSMRCWLEFSSSCVTTRRLVWVWRRPYCLGHSDHGIRTRQWQDGRFWGSDWQLITQHAPQSYAAGCVCKLQAQGGRVYTRFREIILTYLRTDKHFTSDEHGGPQPMGVGCIR